MTLWKMKVSPYALKVVHEYGQLHFSSTYFITNVGSQICFIQIPEFRFNCQILLHYFIYFTSIQIEGFYRIKGCNICVQKSVPLCYNTQNDKVLPISWPNYLPQYKCNQYVIESVIYYIYYLLTNFIDIHPGRRFKLSSLHGSCRPSPIGRIFCFV